MQNDWKEIFSELRSFFRQVPIQRSDHYGGFSGSISLQSLKTIYNLLTNSLQSRKLKMENQIYFDCGFGDGYTLFPMSLTNMKAVWGVDNNSLAIMGINGFIEKMKNNESKHINAISRIFFAEANLENIESFGSVTIVYMLNVAFPPPLNLILLTKMFQSNCIHTVILSYRSIQQTLRYVKRQQDTEGQKIVKYWNDLTKLSTSFTLVYGDNRKAKMYFIERNVQLEDDKSCFPTFNAEQQKKIRECSESIISL